MRESTSSARDYGSAMEATAATEAAGVAVMEAAVAMDAAGVAAAVTGVAAEAAEAAEAVAGMTASAVTVSPKLIAIAKAVLDQDGDYYAASAAVRVRIRATSGLVGIRPEIHCAPRCARRGVPVAHSAHGEGEGNGHNR